MDITFHIQCITIKPKTYWEIVQWTQIVFRISAGYLSKEASEVGTRVCTNWLMFSVQPKSSFLNEQSKVKYILALCVPLWLGCCLTHIALHHSSFIYWLCCRWMKVVLFPFQMNLRSHSLHLYIMASLIKVIK